MSDEQNIKDKSNVKDKKQGEKKISWKSFFSGSVLQSNFIYKQRWYILLLFILSIIYISNRYMADKTFRYSSKVKTSLSEKKTEYVTKSSELMRMSKRSQILEQIKKRNIDLKESTIPPKRVKK